MVSKVTLLRTFGKYCNGNIKTVLKNAELAGKNKNGYSAYSMMTDNGHKILAGFDKNGKPIRRVDITRPKTDGTTITSYLSCETFDFRTLRATVTDSIKRLLKFSLDSKYNVMKMSKGIRGNIKALSDREYYLFNDSFVGARPKLMQRYY